MDYASNDLDNAAAGAPTAHRILCFIKTRGHASTAALAQALEMTPERHASRCRSC